MHIALLNPQGNFDPTDRGWTEHADFGGQLVYVKELALALGRLDCRVDLITRQMDDPAWPEFSGAMDGYPGHENVRILRFPCGPTHFLPKEQLWPYLHEWSNRIGDFYQQTKVRPVAVSAHYADGGLAAVFLQETLDLPFTFTAHSLGAQKMDRFARSPGELAQVNPRFHFDKRIAAERLSMARANKIITSTRQERMQQYGHQAYRGAVDHAVEEKFSLIPPGVNLDIFGHDRRNSVEEAVAEKVEQMLRRDIPAERCHLPVVICSSRVDRKKNHAGLVRAWAVDENLRQAANLMIIIRGSAGPLPETARLAHGDEAILLRELVEIAAVGGLWPCITSFNLDSQAELAACYRHLAKKRQGIFCLPAFHEPFGLAPLEAMAAGLPAVATKNGGPAESLQDESAIYGILVDPNDPRDIARGLAEIACDEQKWESLRQAGRRHVYEKYTWARTAEAYLETMAEIVHRGGAGDRSWLIPGYFKNPRLDDIDLQWLQRILSREAG